MREFNYRRAHKEWATPLFNALPQEVKELFDDVSRICPEINKFDDNGDYAWPEDLGERFAAIPGQLLERASQIIYYYGHWSYLEAVVVHYPGMPPKRFDCSDIQPISALKHAARKWAAAMDAYPVGGFSSDARFEDIHAGPPVDGSNCGYWRFGWLAIKSLAERGWDFSKRGVLRELGFDVDAYKDHAPGTHYSRDELHLLFAEPLAGKFVPLRVECVAHDPHPFVIGPAHVAYASKRCGILDEEALRSHGCYAEVERYPTRLCHLSYDQHTHQTALFLRPLRYLDAQEFAATMTAIKPLAEQHGIDGFAFPGGEVLDEGGKVAMRPKEPGEAGVRDQS